MNQYTHVGGLKPFFRPSRFFTVCFIFVTGYIMGHLASIAPAQQLQAASWLQDIDKAEEARRNTQKPVVMYFYSQRARPCKQMEETTFVDSEVLHLLQNFVLVAVDGEKNQEMRKSMDLIKVPTVVFRSPSGKELDRAIGYKDPEAFKRYLEAVLTTVRGTPGGLSRGARDVLNPTEGAYPFRLACTFHDAKTVHIVGDFNDWRGSSTPMRQVSLGNWEATVYLRDGVYEYLFLVNGEAHRADDRNPYRKPNPFGGMNSVLVVGRASMAPIVQGRYVTFLTYNDQADSVHIAGSFNNWEPIKLFQKPDDRGMWGVRLELPPGDYSYKYVVDGEWVLDPENYLPVTNAEGAMNNSFRVR